MNAKEYLKQVKLCDSNIRNTLEELERLQALATKITASSSGDVVQTSGSHDKMADAVVKITMLQDEFKQDVEEYIIIKKNAVKLIKQVEDTDEFNVLFKRYILFKKWEQIACEMKFTYRWICKLHGRALKSFSDVMDRQKELDRKGKFNG